MKPNINDVVCAEFGVTIKELKSTSRLSLYSIPRFLIMWYNYNNIELFKTSFNLRRLPKSTVYYFITKEFNRDRDLIYYAVKTIDNIMKTDKYFNVKVNLILEQMKYKTDEQI